ncbi:MAG: hypothetical protein WCY89_01505 [Flavobacteriaceae bacterium]
MFSTNQLIFAAFFVVVFIGVMIYSYTKDKKMHSKLYKGSLWVLLAFLGFIGLLFLIKKLLM